MQSFTYITFIVSKNIKTFKFLPHRTSTGWLESPALIITLSHIFHASEKPSGVNHTHHFSSFFSPDTDGIILPDCATLNDLMWNSY